MNKLIRFEHAMVFASLTVLYFGMGYGWVLFVALFFVPDIAFIAYLAGPRFGAWVYNIFHFAGLAAVLSLSGWWLQIDLLLQAGLIMGAHIAFDRMLGYGLKHESGFQNTHLGRIGQDS